jgi:hypothetical protein
MSLSACSSSGTVPAPVDLSGQWEGIATGTTESVAVYMTLSVREDGVITGTIFLPSIPEIAEADGWGRCEGASFSMVFADSDQKGVYVTGIADTLGAQINGEIAVSDSPNKLTFEVFKKS